MTVPRVEMMDHASVVEMANRHARALERPSEQRALIPQGVVFGGVDQRGGAPAKSALSGATRGSSGARPSVR